MTKQLLTEDEYIAELNKQLNQDEYYEEGMEFIPYPEGARGHEMTGYSIKPFFHKVAVFARVALKVSEHFDLK